MALAHWMGWKVSEVLVEFVHIRFQSNVEINGWFHICLKVASWISVAVSVVGLNLVKLFKVASCMNWCQNPMECGIWEPLMAPWQQLPALTSICQKDLYNIKYIFLYIVYWYPHYILIICKYVAQLYKFILYEIVSVKSHSTYRNHVMGFTSNVSHCSYLFLSS